MPQRFGSGPTGSPAAPAQLMGCHGMPLQIHPMGCHIFWGMYVEWIFGPEICRSDSGVKDDFSGLHSSIVIPRELSRYVRRICV